MKKTILALCCLFFTLSGCTKKSDKDIIRFSSWGSKTEIAILKPLIKEFEQKNPDIKIEFIHIPKNYFQKLHLLVASNLTPDVVFVNNLNGPKYVENNIFIDLGKYLETGNSLSEKDFFQKGLKSFEYQNKLYAIPRDISNLVIYYNKDIFDEYQVKYPSKNWNYNDFLKTAKNLTRDTNNDGKIDIFGVSFREDPLFWLPYLWSNGGGFISKDLKTLKINSDKSIESLQFYSDLRNKYHVAPTKSEAGSATMAQLFMQGKLAMHLSGRWFVPIYRKNNKFNWDIVNFPNGTEGSVVGSDASGWAISKSSKFKDKAWRFISFMAGKNSIEKFTESGLIIPSRVDVASSGIFLSGDKLPKSSEVFIEAIENSIPTPVNTNYKEMLDILNEALEPVWLGNKTVDEVIDDKLVLKLQNKLY